jgi:phosphatidyl-myo-inositol dimannoside synthase
MSEINFLLFTLEYPPFKGGIAEYYKNLAKYWPTDDFFVLTNVKNLAYGKPENNNKVAYRKLVNKYIRPRWLPALWQLYKKIHHSSFIIHHSHVIVGQILPLGIVTYHLSKIFKFKYSVILHGLDFSLATKTKRKRQLTEKILQKAEKIICANSYTAKQVKDLKTDLAEKITVINPGVEPLFIRNPARVEELKEKYNLKGKTVLFSLGRLVARKGFDSVIKAMPEIVKNNPEVFYVISGGGPEEGNLKELAAAMPEEVKNKIIILGQISTPDRWAWLELCDIFIMTSRNINGDLEGFGTVYLEANLAGKPVIAGDSGGVRDAVLNNVNGLLINPENIREISAAVIKLAANPSLRNELGEQGKRRTVENFSTKKQTEKIYNQLQIQ